MKDIPNIPSDPYDPTDPLFNAMPAGSTVTFTSPVGFPPLWRHERDHLLIYAREQDAPFVAGNVLAGMNRALTQEEADLLNERFS